jgi:hypothetical protein
VRPTVVVLDGHFKKPFFAALAAAFDAEWRDAAAPSLLAGDPDADIVLVNDETWPHHAIALPECHRRGIPSLHLMGGMLQWRHAMEMPWEQPFLQPALASKIACLGAAQARTLEAWGNAGKCEVTGSHRFDHLIGRVHRERTGRWRLLIATAREPYVDDPTERAATLRGLADVKQWLDAHSVDAVWRLTGGLDRDLGVTNSVGDLGDQLAAVDAVLASASTLMLEAMMLGLPVALLDYSTRPQFVHPAWRVAAPSQLDEVLTALEHPDAKRMRQQNAVLRDNLYCDTPATPRIVALMTALIDAGRRARHTGAPLELPAAILERAAHTAAPPLPASERALLETEINHLRSILRRRPSEIVYRALSELRRMIG